ncbi:hypothetical protein KAS41_02265, partial [Candidatus Parcubacteria bacterium]|nr:hypothetical protein [Candidatus Parcubacteria bacterium]
MFLKRGIKLFLLLFFLFSAGFVLCYDHLIIHPKLTNSAAEIYNSQAGEKLTEEQIGWIIKGSIEEDNDPRYVNHFYNPKTGKGLNYEGFEHKSAKEWAKNQNSATGDYSISAILENYRDGNLKRAYQGIGHILHLIQDMTVPAHTRNDAHPWGDPFEEWAEQYGNVNLEKVSFISVDNLDSAFDNLADYSHSNFYSKDTIIIGELNKYKTKDESINGKTRRYLMNKIDDVEYRIVYSKNPDSIKPIFQIDDDLKLNHDYWNMLYPQAVGYSAGAIDYFIKEFEKIDEEKSAQKKLSVWSKFKNGLSKNQFDIVKYAWGDTFFASRKTATKTFNNSFNKAKKAFIYSALVVESGKEIIADTAKKALAGAAKITSKSEKTSKEPIKSENSGGKVLSAAEKDESKPEEPVIIADNSA